MFRYLPLLLAGALAGTPAFADEPDLNEILDGFDGAPAAQDDGLSDVLEGFDNTPAARDGLSDVLEGFEDGPGAIASGTEGFAPSPLSGSASLSAHYVFGKNNTPAGVDYHGLTRLRSRIDLAYDEELSGAWDLYVSGYAFYDAAYSLNGRNRYPDETLDQLESEAELGVSYLRGRLSRATDVTLGRQIVVWGKSDNLRITDVLNPLDNREPGVTDIRDLRLPLTMGRLDYYVGDWNLTAIAIPEIRFDKQPPYGSAYYPIALPMPPENVPDNGGGNTEYAASASATFSGWDLALYWAQVFDDRSHLVATAAGPRAEHSRLTMNGIAAAAVSGNWVLRAEVAHLDGLKYSSAPGMEFRRTDALFGWDYAGFANATLSLELANRHINNYDDRLLTEQVREDTPQTAIRYQGDFLYDRLHLIALGMMQGNGDGGFSRYQAEYDLSDALSLLGGVVLYHGGDALPFSGIENNDRIISELRYSF